MIERRPALIARPANADEVAKTVGFARHHDLQLAVRGGSHNGAGLGTVDDGFVIDLSQLSSVRDDPGASTVTVGGATKVLRGGPRDQPARARHPSGNISTTGVGRLTLGGGLGYLTRGLGLAIDNLIEAEVVESTMHLYPIDAAAHKVGMLTRPGRYRDAQYGALLASVDSDPANVEEIRRWSVGHQEALHEYWPAVPP